MFTYSLEKVDFSNTPSHLQAECLGIILIPAICCTLQICFNNYNFGQHVNYHFLSLAAFHFYSAAVDLILNEVVIYSDLFCLAMELCFFLFFLPHKLLVFKNHSCTRWSVPVRLLPVLHLPTPYTLLP